MPLILKHYIVPDLLASFGHGSQLFLDFIVQNVFLFLFINIERGEKTMLLLYVLYMYVKVVFLNISL